MLYHTPLSKSDSGPFNISIFHICFCQQILDGLLCYYTLYNILLHTTIYYMAAISLQLLLCKKDAGTFTLTREQSYI